MYFVVRRELYDAWHFFRFVILFCMHHRCIGSFYRMWHLCLIHIFGAEKVAYYFAPIKENSVMFEMGMDEVFNLLEQRGEA